MQILCNQCLEPKVKKGGKLVCPKCKKENKKDVGYYCPNCKNTGTKFAKEIDGKNIQLVIESRKRMGYVYRRRVCQFCLKRFSTAEVEYGYLSKYLTGPPMPILPA